MPINTYRILLFIILVILAGIFFSCQEEDPVREIISEQDLPFQTSIDAEYIFTENTKIRNKLKAGKLEQFQTDSAYIIISHGLELTIYNRAIKKEAILTSKNGWYNQDERVMEARDSVIFENMEGERLFTEKLIWFEDSNTVYTDLSVQIIRQNDTIWGDGLTSNQDFTNYSILNPRGSIFVEEDVIE